MQSLRTPTKGCWNEISRTFGRSLQGLLCAARRWEKDQHRRWKRRQQGKKTSQDTGWTVGHKDRGRLARYRDRDGLPAGRLFRGTAAIRYCRLRPEQRKGRFHQGERRDRFLFWES